MADKAHVLTDEKLEEIEKRLSSIYSISPYLNRDMEKFIKRQRRKEGVYGKAKKGNRPEAVREPLRHSMRRGGDVRHS